MGNGKGEMWGVEGNMGSCRRTIGNGGAIGNPRSSEEQGSYRDP